MEVSPDFVGVSQHALVALLVMLRIHSQRFAKLLFYLARLIPDALRNLLNLKCNVVQGRVESINNAVALL